jgi:hypothetical protein
VCGTSVLSDRSQSPFIASVGSDERAKMVSVKPYTPFRIAVGEDGAFWTVGYEAVNGAESGPGVTVDPNAGVIRRFDASGKLMRSYVSRSTISDVTRLRGGLMGSSKDRIGWYSAGSDGKGGYVEVSYEGIVLDYPLAEAPAGQRFNGYALTNSNQAVIGMTTVDGRMSLHVLDRQTVGWLEIRLPESLRLAKGIRLWGADANELIFGMPSQGKIALQFFTLVM